MKKLSLNFLFLVVGLNSFSQESLNPMILLDTLGRYITFEEQQVSTTGFVHDTIEGCEFIVNLKNAAGDCSVFINEIESGSAVFGAYQATNNVILKEGWTENLRTGEREKTLFYYFETKRTGLWIFYNRGKIEKVVDYENPADP